MRDFPLEVGECVLTSDGRILRWDGIRLEDTGSRYDMDALMRRFGGAGAAGSDDQVVQPDPEHRPAPGGPPGAA